jgi:hypothetical protein
MNLQRQETEGQNWEENKKEETEGFTKTELLLQDLNEKSRRRKRQNL